MHRYLRACLMLMAGWSGWLCGGQFTSLDINTGMEGKTAAAGLTGFDITAAGADIWYGKDGFRFVYVPCTGDFDIKVRVASLQRTHEWAKAGLMVRQSVEPNSAHATMFYAALGAYSYQYRLKAGDDMLSTHGSEVAEGLAWLRLIRNGDTIHAFEGTNDDGSRWREVGVVDIPFKGQVLVGLCLTSHCETPMLGKAEFRELELEMRTKGVAGRGNGLKATYWENEKLEGAGLVRADPFVNFRYGFGPPFANFPADHFSVRWEGEIEAPYDEDYTFYLRSDDGSRLWVNHQPVGEMWKAQNAAEMKSMPVAMKAGQKVAVRLEYFEVLGSAEVSLSWSSKSTLKQTIPKRQLYSEGGSAVAANTDPAERTANVSSKPVSEETARPVARREVEAEYVPLDKNMAAALAAGAAKLAADNKPEKARELCFKALANDEACPEALFELGKLLEKEGKPAAAANFFVRAAREWAKGAEMTPALQSKRLEAERRLMALNPHAAKYTAMLTEYSLELGAILKKNSESLSQDVASERVRTLKLREMVAADKLPKIDKTAAAGGKAAGPALPIDVEKALKAAGWKDITGRWVKKAENVYEVSDGKLTAPMTNGALQLVIHKGGGGTVKAFVRNAHSDYFSSYYSYGSGYGASVEGNSCKLFTPYNYSGMVYRPYTEREAALPESFPKHVILVQVIDGNLEITVNGKREHRSNYKLSKDGPFMIEVEGTMTLEAPQARGN